MSAGPPVPPFRAILLGFATGCALAGALACGREAAEPEASSPAATEPGPATVAIDTAVASYVSDATCQACHAEAFAAWSGSHHDLAMQPATRETVLGDFEDTTFRGAGATAHFANRDGRYFVRTEGADGELAEFEVAYTFGADPLQQYLVPFPDGRLQALSIAWDTRPREAGGQRWFHLYPDAPPPPGDPFHWTGRYQSWNLMCAECHSTHLQKGYDPAGDRYDTTWAELDVGCQACHGPGSRHLAWAQHPAGSADRGLGGDWSADEVERCAPCHSRRHRVSAEDRSGRPLHDDWLPQLLAEGLYHPDGQILGEVYVYGSFVQSRMFAAGVRCTDCHDPHALTLAAEGNALCTRCHGEEPDPRFPNLVAKVYDAPEHHHHAVGSPGALCVDCHMPARTYMEVDPRRDHSFRIPRPDLTLRLGTPNACEGCHASQGPDWAAAAIADWFGREASPETHFAVAIAAGRTGEPAALGPLMGLAADPDRPAIVRATALDLLVGYGAPAGAAFAAATRDESPLVRAAAARGLRVLRPDRLRAEATPLLRDPIRAVRSEAARVLAPVASQLDPAARRAHERALAEYEQAQLAMADTPAARLNLGVTHEGAGRSDLAEASYLAAIAMDPEFMPVHANLANLYNRTGRNPEALRVLRDAVARFPEEGELHYSLGLLLAEEGRLEESTVALGRAAALLPERARVHYNYGLALQHQGRRDEALAQLLRAHALDADDPSVLHALAILFVQAEDWPRALPWAEQLWERTGGSREASQLLDSVRRGLAGATPVP